MRIKESDGQMESDKTGRFSFLGRPDGLGNRIEEIIRLESICSKIDAQCDYIWQNQHSERSYDIHLRGDNVSIVNDEMPRHPVKTWSDFGFAFGQYEILASAKKVMPDFPISFPESLRPVGVHIRGTDRIGVDHHPHFMKDETELRLFISETIAALNKIRPRFVFVCSESEQCRSVLLRHLEPGINIIEPNCDRKIPAEYVDLFALALCREIWMVSRFSSFSITAALLGNIPLFTFVDDQEVRSRYQAMFRYRDMIGSRLVKGALIGQTAGVIGVLERFKQRINRRSIQSRNQRDS